jgi:hypothetical protein
MTKMTILAIFRSRTQALDCSARLKKYGVEAETMPTPKEAKVGCGLCVRFDERVFTRAKAVILTARYSTFKGFYKMDFFNGKTVVFPIR